MSTLYVHTVTAIVPETLFSVGNTLAFVFGESGEGNLLTFRNARYTRHGERFAIEPAQCKATLASVIQALAEGSVPALPEEWSDTLPATRNECLAALESAQVVLTFDPEDPPAYEGGILFALDVDWLGLAEAMGFIALDSE